MILFVFCGCMDANNNRQKKWTASNVELLGNANLEFAETLIFYEDRINYTDSIGSTVKSFLNPYKIKGQYDSVAGIFTNKGASKKLISDVIDNLTYTRDSLIKENIEYDFFKWEGCLEKIESGILDIKDDYGGQGQLSDVDYFLLRVKVESIYNLVFQLVMRHKMEEEYRHDIRVPEVVEDRLLDDGRRELKIQAVSGGVGDGSSLEVYVDGEKVEARVDVLGFTYSYDPNNVGDSLTIKTVSKTYLNDEIIEAFIKYEVKKE